MLAGDNSILTRTTEARTNTIHASVYEQLRLEALAYVTDKATSKTTLSLTEYLNSKHIIGDEIGENTGKYQVNVTELLGSKQSLGNGNATSELKDVYMLEKQNPEAGSTINTKVATTTHVRIAETNTNKATYNVVYYGNNATEHANLGNLEDTLGSVAISEDLVKLKEYFEGKNLDTIINNDDTFKNLPPIMDASTSIEIIGGDTPGALIIKYKENYYTLVYDESNFTVTEVRETTEQEKLYLLFVEVEQNGEGIDNPYGDGEIVKYNEKYYRLNFDDETVEELTEQQLPIIKMIVNSGEDGVVQLPINNRISVTIDWGDGTVANVDDSYKIAELNKIRLDVAARLNTIGFTHTYTEKNKEFTVTITGAVYEMNTVFTDCTPDKIIEIVQWGETGLSKLNLSGCVNLRKIAQPTERSFSLITSFDSAFAGCTSLTGTVPELWNLSNVTSGVDCFKDCTLVSNYSSIPDDWK